MHVKSTLFFGLDGNHFVIGSQGNDFLYGGTDNDTFYGNQGSDFIHGGDVFRAHSGDGIDTVDYGTWDSFTERNTAPITITLESAPILR